MRWMSVILRVGTDYFVTPGDVRDAVEDKLGAEVELEGRSELEVKHAREVVEAGAELDRWNVPRDGMSLVERIRVLGQNFNEAALSQHKPGIFTSESRGGLIASATWPVHDPPRSKQVMIANYLTALKREMKKLGAA